MIRRLVSIGLTFGIWLIAACAQPTPVESPSSGHLSEDDVGTIVAETLAAEDSAAQEPIATNTPLPSPTPLPPTEAPTQASQIAEFSTDEKWARNYLGGADSGGVIIEVVRIVIGYKSAITDQPFDELNDYVEGWADIDVVGEILFKVTNNSDKTASVYPDQGTLQIGSEQIELFENALFMSVGEDTSGDIFPGVTKIGGLWFGIKRSTPPEVTQMIFRSGGPNDADFNDMGPDYEIVLDVSEHVWEDIPDELK